MRTSSHESLVWNANIKPTFTVTFQSMTHVKMSSDIKKSNFFLSENNEYTF